MPSHIIAPDLSHPTGRASGAKGADGAGSAMSDAALDLDEMKANAARASRLLKAIGNERRLLILCYLTQGERSVGELERLVGLSQSALSQHLSRLRADNLVATRRQAQTIFYSLAGEEVPVIMRALHDLFCGSGDAPPQQSEPVTHG